MSECTTNNKSNVQVNVNSTQGAQPKATATLNPIEVEHKQMINNTSTNDILFKNGTPNKKEKWTKGWRDEACFGTAMDQSMLQDFDFEKNLALFDKEGLWKKLNASQKPDVVRQTDGAKNKQKYRYVEKKVIFM